MAGIRTWAGAAVCGLTLASAGVAHAATFTVTSPADSGSGTFRIALEDAKLAAGADGIEIAIPGAGPHEIKLASPLPTIDHSVSIAGPGADQVELHGDSSFSDGFRVLTVAGPGTQVSISGVGIEKGFVRSDGPGAGKGGGILVTNGARLILTEARVSDNVSLGFTGASSCVSGGPGGPAFGGGIHVDDGSVELVRSTVSGNTALGGTGGHGIGNTMQCPGPAASGGTGGSGSGGGLSVNNGSLTLIASTVSGNSARGGSGGGGGIGGFPLTGGASGGGIWLSGTGSIESSSVSGNRSLAMQPTTGNASGGGMSVAALGGPLEIDASTIAANEVVVSDTNDNSEFGANINRNAGTIRIRSSIVADGVGGGSGSCLGPGIDSQGFNIEDGGPSCGFNAPTDVGSVAFDLPALAQNGGPTATHALPLGSPAIDQGHSGGATIDQRGFPRIFDVAAAANNAAGDATDIGAFEYVDTDGDGIENGADGDDDNDGVADASDACPLDASDSVDTDADGACDSSDADDDNDGVPDGEDDFPLDPTRFDGTAPTVTLGGAKTQALGKNVKVKVASDEASGADAAGKIVAAPPKKNDRPAAKRNRKRFKLGAVSATLLAGEAATLRLKIPKKAQRTLAKLLSQGWRAKAKVTTLVTDAAGNATDPGVRTIKIKPKPKKR